MVKPTSITDRGFIFTFTPKRSLDVHSVIPTSSPARDIWIPCFVIGSLTSFWFLVASKNSSLVSLFWGMIAAGFFAIIKCRNWVKKESVLIIPGLGVQLETLYLSGRKACRFIPMDKILKPVLVERVTPVTCYWSLSLILRREAELMLVFKLHPPLKMLVPVWKALCAATDADSEREIDAEKS